MARGALLVLLLPLLLAAQEAPPLAERSVSRDPWSWPDLATEDSSRGEPARICNGGNATAPLSCVKPWNVQRFEGAFWERSRLSRAAVAAHDPDAWRPLLAKLRRGEPITVLGMGSSVVEGHSGCWAADAGVVSEAGVATAPPFMARLLNVTGECRSAGYVSAFMAAINATWPHRSHLYVNAGVSASSIYNFEEANCYDMHLPRSIDLLLFQLHGEAETPRLVRATEALYRTLLQKMAHPGVPAPPLVILNVFVLLDDPKAANDTKISACVNTFPGGQSCTSSACSPEASARLVARVTHGAGTAAEDVIAAAARAYGWSVLSLRNAIAAGVRDDYNARINWTECEFVNAFLKDWVHPTLPGRRLLGDAMLQLLLAAQDLDGEAQAHGPAFGVLPTQLPSAPLFGGASRGKRQHACADARQLQPARAAGWALVTHELVNGVLQPKPGWVANTSGAVLELNISTRFAALPQATRVQLAARYLTSYELMGNAELTCVSGCECAPTALQGHVTEHVSVEKVASVNVSQSQGCVLRLRVLEQSDSSGAQHKVKLMGLAWTAEPPPSNATEMVPNTPPFALLPPAAAG